MDNQHRIIKGYRELSQDEIDLMNKIKVHGEQLRLLVEELRATGADTKWLGMGEEKLQIGVMCLVRSVAKPESF
jgi:hypothetical protein